MINHWKRDKDLEMKSEAELFDIAKELGLTQHCAVEMIGEHIGRQNREIPRYVRLGLNRASSINDQIFKIACKKTQRWLDVEFGFNAENIHDICGFTVNRHKLTNEWYVC